MAVEKTGPKNVSLLEGKKCVVAGSFQPSNILDGSEKNRSRERKLVERA